MSTRSFSRTPSSWDPQDDILLRHLKENKKLGWKEIAGHFTNRTPNACQFRWRRLKSGSLKTNGGINKPSRSTTPPDPVGTAAVGLSTLSSGIRSSKGTTANYWNPPSLSSFNSTGNAPINIMAEQDLSNSISSLNSMDSTDSLRRSFSGTEALVGTASHLFGNSSVQSPWTGPEDDLLSSKRRRELSLTELSILLPSRTEDEILERIKFLERQLRSSSVSTLNHPELHTLSRTLSTSSQLSLASSGSFVEKGSSDPSPYPSGRSSPLRGEGGGVSIAQRRR